MKIKSESRAFELYREFLAASDWNQISPLGEIDLLFQSLTRELMQHFQIDATLTMSRLRAIEDEANSGLTSFDKFINSDPDSTLGTLGEFSKALNAEHRFRESLKAAGYLTAPHRYASYHLAPRHYFFLLSQANQVLPSLYYFLHRPVLANRALADDWIADRLSLVVEGHSVYVPDRYLVTINDDLDMWLGRVAEERTRIKLIVETEARHLENAMDSIIRESHRLRKELSKFEKDLEVRRDWASNFSKALGSSKEVGAH